MFHFYQLDWYINLLFPLCGLVYMDVLWIRHCTSQHYGKSVSTLSGVLSTQTNEMSVGPAPYLLTYTSLFDI